MVFGVIRIQKFLREVSLLFQESVNLKLKSWAVLLKFTEKIYGIIEDGSVSKVWTKRLAELR